MTKFGNLTVGCKTRTTALNKSMYIHDILRCYYM